MQVTITNDWFTDDDAKKYLEVGQTYDVDELVYHEALEVRWEAAQHGYGLDVLVNDKIGSIRQAVEDYLEEHNYKSVFEWAEDNGVDIDIDEWLNADEWIKREQVAKQGYSLDILVNDKGSWVRKAVARQGYGLDVLINDEEDWVRLEVARKGYGLDKLVYDKYSEVRKEVVYQGYGLDVLVDDENWSVRQTVARQGYGLDVLVNDEEYLVREAVAEQGYGLDVLINDENKWVCETVKKYLRKHCYKSIDVWAKANPDKVHGMMDIEITDHLKDFVYKIEGSNTLKVESSYESAEAFFNDCSYESYNSNETLVILTVDTKVPLIKIEKSLKDKKQLYKIIVDITNEDGDSFNVKSIITSKDKFNQLLESTVEALESYPQFSKYASDLESCL